MIQSKRQFTESKNIGFFEERSFLKNTTLAVYFAFALWLLTCPRPVYADTGQYLVSSDIPRLCLAVALSDFPIEQGNIKGMLGISKYSLLSSTDVASGASWIAALTDPHAEFGYYAMRMLYRTDYKKLPPPESIEILSIEVIFVNPAGCFFIRDPNDAALKALPQHRALMKKLGYNPAKFSHYYFEMQENLLQNPGKKSNE